MAVTAVNIPTGWYHYSKNEIIIELQSDIDVALFRVRIQIGVQIFVAGLSGVGNIIIMEEMADADGKVIFDIAGLVDEAIKNLYTVPTPDAAGFALIENAPILFSAEYSEFKDDVLETAGDVNGFADGLPWIALKGGLSSDYIDQYADTKALMVYGNGDPAIKPFLTWQPKSILVDKERTCPLYYLNNLAPNYLQVELRIYAGTTALTITDPLIFVDTPADGIYIIYCGWKNLDIDSMIDGDPEAENVTHWTVRLINEMGDPYSELRTFYLDNRYFKKKTYLTYQNSLNGFDEITLFGEEQQKADYTKTVSAITGISDFTPMEGTRTTFEVVEQFGKKVNTGYLSPLEMNALRELFLSARVYEVVDHARLKAVELTEKSKDLTKNTDYLNGVSIEFIYTTKNRTFTDNPAAR